VLRRRVWSRNIKNGCSIYIYDISRLRVKQRALNIRSTHLAYTLLEFETESVFLC